MAKSFVGIDIGSRSIKVVEIELRGGRKILKAVGEIAVPPDIDKIISKNSVETLASYLKNLILSTNIKNKKISGSFASYRAEVNFIKLPLMPEKDLSQAMYWQLKKNVSGYPEKKSAFWDILNKEYHYDILIVAVEPESIGYYLDVFKKADLEPTSLEIEPVSLKRSLIKDKGNNIIFHLEYDFTSISFYKNNQLSYTRSLKIGVNDLIKVVKGSNMNISEAEKILFKFGFLKIKNKDIYNKISIIFSQVTQELKRTVNFFEEKNDTEIKKIILSGIGANLPDVDNELIKVISHDVLMANPWTDLDIAPHIDAEQLVPLGPKFAVTVGLALL